MSPSAPLRLLLIGASRMGYVGLPPKPAWGFHPQTPSSLRACIKLYLSPSKNHPASGDMAIITSEKHSEDTDTSVALCSEGN